MILTLTQISILHQLALRLNGYIKNIRISKSRGSFSSWKTWFPLATTILSVLRVESIGVWCRRLFWEHWKGDKEQIKKELNYTPLSTQPLGMWRLIASALSMRQSKHLLWINSNKRDSHRVSCRSKLCRHGTAVVSRANMRSPPFRSIFYVVSDFWIRFPGTPLLFVV